MGLYGEVRAPSKYSETNVKPEAPSTISGKFDPNGSEKLHKYEIILIKPNDNKSGLACRTDLVYPSF